jgi:hypothetical protein
MVTRGHTDDITAHNLDFRKLCPLDRGPLRWIGGGLIALWPDMICLDLIRRQLAGFSTALITISSR